MKKPLELRKQKWQEKKKKLQDEYEFKEEKKSFFKAHRRIKKINTTKLLIAFLFLTCTLIMLFTGWITVQTIDLSQKIVVAPDFTPLVALIGAVVGEVMGFGIYCVKSTKENTQGGIVYAKAMLEQMQKEKQEEDNG